MGCGSHRCLQNRCPTDPNQEGLETQTIQDQMNDIRENLQVLQDKIGRIEQVQFNGHQKTMSSSEIKFDNMTLRRQNSMAFKSFNHNLELQTESSLSQETFYAKPLSSLNRAFSLKTKKSIRPKFVNQKDDLKLGGCFSKNLTSKKSKSSTSIFPNNNSSGLANKSKAAAFKNAHQLNLKNLTERNSTYQSELGGTSSNEEERNTIMTPIQELPSPEKKNKEFSFCNLNLQVNQGKSHKSSLAQISTNNEEKMKAFEEIENQMFDLINQIRQNPKLVLKMIDLYTFEGIGDLFQEDLNQAKEIFQKLGPLPHLFWSPEIKEGLKENSIQILGEELGVNGNSNFLIEFLKEKNIYCHSDLSCSLIQYSFQLLPSPQDIILFLLLSLDSPSKLNRKLLLNEGFSQIGIYLTDNEVSFGLSGEFVTKKKFDINIKRKNAFLNKPIRLIKKSTGAEILNKELEIYGDLLIRKSQCKYSMQDSSAKEVLVFEKLFLNRNNDIGSVTKAVQ